MKNKTENLIHFVTDVAKSIVEYRMGAQIIWQEREEGSEGFTEEAQDLFCEVCDIIEPIIIKHINR
jgi:glycine betaine/choline ABC-type transport system substrate-binding protein